MNSKTIEERFWSKVNKTDGCWLWTASTKGRHSNYGSFKYNGKTAFAHRVAYLLSKGPIGPKECVCHKCDNPLCVNPEHLFLGSQIDNIADRTKKNRSAQPKGALNPASKITQEQANLIRELYKTGDLSQTALSAQFGVSQVQISNIVNNKSW